MTNSDKILDISVNLARISDWILSEDRKKARRVDQFLEQTQGILSDIDRTQVKSSFKSTLSGFEKEFNLLLSKKNKIERSEWAERALTWANILQHRAKLV